MTIRPADSAAIAEAARLLRDGALVAFPTETVYGLGADATQDRAVAAIYQAKGRPSFNPLIAHVATLEAALALGVFDRQAQQLAEQFWPGPLTLVVRRRSDCPVSLLASAGLDSLAIRVPAHPIAQQLLEAVGRPLAAPSANPSGRVSPTTAAHVAAGLRLPMILDGGPCSVGLESTILDLSGATPCLLRPGGLDQERLEAQLGPLARAASNDQTPQAPGMLSSHYAPGLPVRLDAVSVQPGEAWLGFGANCPGATHNLSPSGDLVEAAAHLFAMLRDLDRPGFAAIAVAPIPMSGLGVAINDRLQRAAAPRPMN